MLVVVLIINRFNPTSVPVFYFERLGQRHLLTNNSAQIFRLLLSAIRETRSMIMKVAIR